MKKLIQACFGSYNLLLPQNHFIISAPRSGTTWLSKALNVHPKIYCTERRLFGEYADFIEDEGALKPRLRVTLDKYISSSLLHSNFPKKINIKNHLISTFLKKWNEIEIKTSDKRMLIDKITPYEGTSDLVADRINFFFPKSKIVYLLRDGRDVTTSGVFHWFNKNKMGHNQSDFEKKRHGIILGLKHRENHKIERFFTEEEITEWANTWVEPLHTIPVIKQKHKILIIRFEEMLLDQSAVLRKLFNFFHTSGTKKIIEDCVNSSSFRKMTGGREKGEEEATAHIRKGIYGDWKNYFTKRDGELFSEIAGKELLKFGYETDHNWHVDLPHNLQLI